MRVHSSLKFTGEFQTVILRALGLIASKIRGLERVGP